MRCPPENSQSGFCISSLVNPNFFTAVKYSFLYVYPPPLSNSSQSREYLFTFCSQESRCKSSSALSISFSTFNNSEYASKISSNIVLDLSSLLVCFKNPMTGLPLVNTPYGASFSPFCASTSPVKTLRSVVLPHPLRPTSAIFSFSCTTKSTCKSTGVPSYSTATFDTLICISRFYLILQIKSIKYANKTSALLNSK